MDGAIVALQLEVVALRLASVQGVPVNVPVAVPLFVKATDPPGAEVVPVELSFTNAVHVTVWPTNSEAGVQLTMLIVLSSPTVTVFAAVGPLPLCLASDGVYVPLAMTVPVLVGVNETLQLDVVALTLANVHGDPVKLPVAVPPLVNATVPSGADAVTAAEVFFTKPVLVFSWVKMLVAVLHGTDI